MNDSIWQTLALSPTADTRAIKRAYAKVLKTLDPNDRDRFITLRDAYEQALQWAAWQEDDDGDWNSEPFEPAQEHSESSDLEMLYSQALDALPESPSQTRFDNEAQEHPENNDLETLYNQALDALPEISAQENSEAETVDTQNFIERCWQSWQESDSEDALLHLLHEQHKQLADKDITATIDYGDALLHWFYHTDNAAPRAFSWATDKFQWMLYAGDWRLRELFERYPFMMNPALGNYPALSRWDAQWQQGFAARFLQAIHPGQLREALDELPRYLADRWSDAYMPESVAALEEHAQTALMPLVLFTFLPIFFFFFIFSPLIAWRSPLLAVYLGIACAWVYGMIFSTMQRLLRLSGNPLRDKGIKIASLACALWIVATVLLWRPAEESLKWLLQNFAAIFILLIFAMFWQRMFSKNWYVYRTRVFLEISIFWGIILFLLWFAAYSRLDAHDLAPIGYAVVLPPIGALFTASIMRRTALADKPRRQYTGTLLLSGLMLPLFAAMLGDGAFANAHEGVLRWMLKIYFLISMYGIFTTQAYRRWSVALPMIAGMAIFAAFVFMPLPVLYLLYFHMAVWLLMPFAVLITPKFPRIGFFLPETLRSFAQCAAAFCLPLLFWQHDWYLAFVASLIAVFYLMWLDAEIDEALI